MALKWVKILDFFCKYQSKYMILFPWETWIGPFDVVAMAEGESLPLGGKNHWFFKIKSFKLRWVWLRLNTKIFNPIKLCLKNNILNFRAFGFCERFKWKNGFWSGLICRRHKSSLRGWFGWRFWWNGFSSMVSTHSWFDGMF